MEKIKALFGQIKNHIDNEGKVKDSPEEVNKSIATAEKLCESLLGCTLHVRGKSFVIMELEIYYGSIGDPLHDWFRKRHGMKTKSRLLEHTSVIENEGFRIYMKDKRYNAKNKRMRMDIVVGMKGVAISFLLRSVSDKDGNVNPNSTKGVIDFMGIKDGYHGLFIENKSGLNQIDTEKVFIENTRERIMRDNGFSVVRTHRVMSKGQVDQFGLDHSLKWNFSLRK